MQEKCRIFALVGAPLLAMSSPAAANDWMAVRAGELLRERSGSVAVTVGGVFNAEGKSATGRLSAYCMDNATVVTIEASDLFLGMSPIHFKYQLDGGAAKSVQWDACVGGECMGVWNDKSVAFLRELFDRQELKIEIIRNHQQPIMASFHVSGARTNLEALAHRCGWKS